MANGKRPDYRVFVTTKNGEKDFFHEVGVAWNVKNGGISIKLHALPPNGECVAFPPRDDDK
jgi:hypothetical protein